MKRGFKLALGVAAGGAASILISDYFHASKAQLDIPNVYREPRATPQRGKSFLADFTQRILDLGRTAGPPSQPTAIPGTRRLPPISPEADGSEKAPLPPAAEPPLRLPCTVRLAKECTAEVSKLRRDVEVLVAQHPLPPRFTDAELMRHAVHHGLLRATDDSARARALANATASVAHTIEWLSKHTFSSDDELERFAHLAWWAPPVEGQRPTLHVAIGRAALECRGPAAVQFANAVITHVERAVKERLKDEDGADRVNVVVYAAGASTLSASRAGWVLKAVVSALSRHYPGRLNELTLLDLPKVLLWALHGAQRLLQPETARKVRTMSSIEWDAHRNSTLSKIK